VGYKYVMSKVYLEVDPVIGRLIERRYEDGQYNKRLPPMTRLEFEDRGDAFYLVVVLLGTGHSFTKSVRKAVEEIIDEAERDTQTARRILRIVNEFRNAALKSVVLEGVDWIW